VNIPLSYGVAGRRVHRLVVTRALTGSRAARRSARYGAGSEKKYIAIARPTAARRASIEARHHATNTSRRNPVDKPSIHMTVTMA
jgi:hypothetical protein